MRQVQGPDATVRMEVRDDDGSVVAVVYLQVTVEEWKRITGGWSNQDPDYGATVNYARPQVLLHWIDTGGET